ncbi:MAG: ATP-dependent 6-phosphofructokinase [Pirellulaceae bacterium]|jgi:6-phosphofructokinase 1|nr:ATP-dependent 6-phosphofructokinase [Pirellulaceae bacterium]MDP7020525.1 ATP-dependent 6-phosphofructokinase [Pirellulaceae bacterium]
MSKSIGILTSGGDCPGLNAAIRGVGKPALELYDMTVLGFRDGFRGLVQDRLMRLDTSVLSGILTDGGTILGTSRDKPHRMPFGGKTRDMTDAIVDTYHRHHLDVVICLGGGGTQKNALRLHEAGLNVLTLPKTIDNDVAKTDVTFGFDTALSTATEAIDRLHSTATSHHRIIVVEIMGHRAGWLALGAGIAGGADVILIPEIPYTVASVARAITTRARQGKRFSIVAVAEGALTAVEQARTVKLRKRKAAAKQKATRKRIANELDQIEADREGNTQRLTKELESLTGIESRLTILGHLQRGGTPSAADRLLATRLGTACTKAIAAETFGCMVASRGDGSKLVPLKDVANERKLVPPNHPWVKSARLVGTCLGDE